MNMSEAIAALLGTIKKILLKPVYAFYSYREQDFQSKVMLAPDYICNGCKQPVYVWLAELKEHSGEFQFSCQCNSTPELTDMQVSDLVHDMLAGTAHLEEVF